MPSKSISKPSSKAYSRFMLVALVLICIVAGGYWFRVDLLRFGANTFLASQNISVEAVNGIDISAGGATVDAITLQFHEAGLQLLLADVDVHWQRDSIVSLPLVHTVNIASAKALQAATAVSAESETPGMPFADVLALLRDFPLANIAIAEITLPQWPDSISLAMQHQPAELALQVASEALRLDAVFTQPGEDAPARLQLVLDHGTDVLGNVLIALEPEASGWQLASEGHVDLSAVARLPQFSAANAIVLPVSGGQIDWQASAIIADELMATMPSTIELSLAAGSFVTVPPGVFAEAGAIDIELTAAAQATIAVDDDFSLRDVVIPLAVAGSYQSESFDMAASVTAADCKLNSTSVCVASVDANARIESIVIAAADPLTVRHLTFSGGGSVEASTEYLQLSLNANSRIEAESIASSVFDSRELSFVSTAPLVVHRESGNGDLRLGGAHVTTTLGQFDAAEYRLQSDIHVRDIDVLLATDTTGQFVLETRGFTASGPQPWLPAMDIAANVIFDAAGLSFTTPLLLPDAPADPALRLQGTYEFASSIGSMNLNLPRLGLDGEGRSLSSYLGGWPWSFDLMTGEVNTTIALQWLPGVPANAQDAGDTADSGRLTGSIEAVLSNAGGYYNEMFFRGLDSTISATLDSSKLMPLNSPPLSLAIEEIDIGLPISNIAANFQFDSRQNSLVIHSIYGETLGGSLTGERVAYNLDAERNQINLQFDGLRLDRMLELVEYDGVDASGAVSGELPITITAQGVEVDKGRLEADFPGGSIVYHGTGESGGNAALDLVNEALSNYQFESLQSSIDYLADGELLLSMQLVGHNPDMNDGQRINLNLNLSDNIPVLLQSLQTGRAIEDFVQEHYQRNQDEGSGNQ